MFDQQVFISFLRLSTFFGCKLRFPFPPFFFLDKVKSAIYMFYYSSEVKIVLFDRLFFPIKDKLEYSVSTTDPSRSSKLK